MKSFFHPWRLRKILRQMASCDPYAFRCTLAFLVLFGLGAAWGQWGSAYLAQTNPQALRYWRAQLPDINMSIVPPDYTGMPPRIIASPAGLVGNHETLDVPVGSTLIVHVSRSGRTPVLQLNGTAYALVKDEHGAYALTRAIEKGDVISLSQGWGKPWLLARSRASGRAAAGGFRGAARRVLNTKTSGWLMRRPMFMRSSA